MSDALFFGVKMMKDNCLKEFLKYVSLNVLGMLGLSCYILADTFFISRGLGADGLTALNLAIPAFSFVSGCGMMLGMGGSAKFTILKAQGKNEMCRIIFMNTIYLSFGFSLIFSASGLFLSDRLAALLGAEGNIFEMTNIYLKIILLFSPAFILNNVLNCYVRNNGSPDLAMAGMLFGSLSNIVFDYIFIFPMHLGILGAVLATGFSPIVGLLILSFHFMKKKNGLRLGREHFSSSISKDIIILGIPSLITELSSGVVMIVFNGLIMRLEGNVGVAAYGVVANISIVVISVFTGVAQGLQPVSSRAFGENDLKKTRKVLFFAVFTVLLTAFVIYGFIFIFSKETALVFNRDRNEQLQTIAENGLKLYFIGIFFAGINIVFSVFFMSVERPYPAWIISSGRGFAVIVPLAFFMAHFFGINGIWLTFPLTEIILNAVSFILLKRIRSKKL